MISPAPRLPLVLLALLALLPPAARAADQDPEAMRQAQAALDRGAALFGDHDAVGLAATYDEDARLIWIQKDQDAGAYRIEEKHGRPEIEALYRKLFDDSPERTTARNHITAARLVAPDLLVIHGDFQPNTSNDGKVAFVQVRRKAGDRWLILSLDLLVAPAD